MGRQCGISKSDIMVICLSILDLYIKIVFWLKIIFYWIYINYKLLRHINGNRYPLAY